MTSADEAEEKPKEIFGSAASATASLWVRSGVWAGFQLSRWLLGLRQSVIPRKFFLLSLLPVLISRVSSACRAAACSVPGQPQGSQSRLCEGLWDRQTNTSISEIPLWRGALGSHHAGGSPCNTKTAESKPRIQQSSGSFLHLIPTQYQTTLFLYLCAAKSF